LAFGASLLLTKYGAYPYGAEFIPRLSQRDLSRCLGSLKGFHKLSFGPMGVAHRYVVFAFQAIAIGEPLNRKNRLAG